MQRYRQV